MPIRGGYSAFSGGPIFDTTPKDASLSTVCGTGMITDSSMQNSASGPPYQVPASDGAEFNRLKNKLARQPGVTNPAGLAASIERKKGLMK